MLEDGDLRMRAQLFSEDGSEMIEDRACSGGVRARRPTSPDRSWKRRRIDREVVRRSMKRVLVLRPEPGASATVKRAKERGLDALAIPLFEVRPVDWDVPDAGSFDGLLLTSANAVRHSGEQLKELRGLPVHAVGAATAAAARRPASMSPAAEKRASSGCSVRSSRI